MKNIGIGTYAFGFTNGMTLGDKLKAAKEMGYSGIEFLAMDLQEHSVEQLRDMLTANGLAAMSAHAGMEQIPELMPKLARLGAPMIVCPGHPFADIEEAKSLAGLLEELGRAARDLGMKVGYHNHTSEFFEVDGRRLLDVVIEESDPDLVGFQLDCGWAAAAGVDCPSYIGQFTGRFMAVHVKENNALTGADKPRSAKEPAPANPFKLGPDGKPVMTDEVKAMIAAMQEKLKIQCPMGDPSSKIDWTQIKRAVDKQPGDCLWIVEREYDYLGDILACLKEDCQWLADNL